MNEEKEKAQKTELPFHWRQVQAAIWLIGLAILFWLDWFWPGILVLMAISGLFQAAVYRYTSRQEEQQLIERARAVGLPANCPNCGAAVDATQIKWTGPTNANCSYCGSGLKVSLEEISTPSEKA